MSTTRWFLLACILGVLALLVGVLAMARPDWFQLPDFGGPAAGAKGEPARHGFMGVAFKESEDGLVVKEALEDSPAALAGVQAGDVIIGIGGVDRPGRAKLQEFMNTTRPGQEIDVTLRRGEETINVRMKLISYGESAQLERSQRRQEP